MRKLMTVVLLSIAFTGWASAQENTAAGQSQTQRDERSGMGIDSAHATSAGVVHYFLCRIELPADRNQDLRLLPESRT